MLSKIQVLKEINAKNITIGYSFLPNKDGQLTYTSEEVIDPDNLASKAGALFSTNFFGDRLGLTLGPIVKTHGSNFLKGRKKYGRRKCFDIRQSQNTLTIHPRETVTAITNERIQLSDSIAASTTPRLSLASAGLIFIPSYIDPNWNGILQCTITNVTDNPVVLKLGEKIGICRFYKLVSSADKNDRIRFPEESHHFGNNWKRIIENSADPFPVKLVPQNVSNFNLQGFFRITRHLLSAANQYGLIAAIGAIALSAYFVTSTFRENSRLFSDFEDMKEKVILVDGRKEADNKLLKSLETRIADSGEVIIKIPKNTTSFNQTLIIQRPFEKSDTIWVSEKSGLVRNLKAAIYEETADSERLSATIEGNIDKSTSNRTIIVQWLIVD